MLARAARTAIATAAGAAGLALPVAAPAATVATDRACYPADRGQAALVRGEGFAPGGQVLVLVNGGIVASTTADALGVATASVEVPDPPEEGRGAHETEFRIALQQGGTTAETRARSARRLADFSPDRGDPAGLRVRFSAFGFGLARAAGQRPPSIYVHYVDPKGKHRRTVRLGTGRGPCGSIARTARRPLFPFLPRNGRWTLQFDTRRRYARATSRSTFAWDRVTLTVSDA